MKNIRKILLTLIILAVIILGIIWTIFNQLHKIQNQEKMKNMISGGFPYNLEFENYNVKINSAKIFEDYILFDYIISTKDKSDIKMNNVCLSCIPITSDNSYFSISNISTEVNKDTLHIIETCDIIARENKHIPFSYKFCISANNSNEGRYKKEFSTKENFSLVTQGYIPINKKIKFDNINFNLISLGNFNFGSLFTILTENIDQEKCKEICQQYSIKLKSKNFEKIYSLEDRNGFTDVAIKKISKLDKRYDPNSKFDQFYIAKMFYNINDINRNDMKIYLVNNISNEEICIY